MAPTVHLFGAGRNASRALGGGGGGVGAGRGFTTSDGSYGPLLRSRSNRFTSFGRERVSVGRVVLQRTVSGRTATRAPVGRTFERSVNPQTRGVEREGLNKRIS